MLHSSKWVCFALAQPALASSLTYLFYEQPQAPQALAQTIAPTNQQGSANNKRFSRRAAGPSACHPPRGINRNLQARIGTDERFADPVAPLSSESMCIKNRARRKRFARIRVNKP
jgi:hypothetical protein